ncbi:hypothetical protein IscW_ISCW019248 [Ixodes scapularis]|uniref:Uncharacterized protein n=1 Tax=Ixodes scapularis TaxID=6945 RepID=B7PW22_IXOSC|nr:hypothetical protein IscW_ISCW019248 [Ixodes scapularis]|eukprot:XP_002409110.1 hypothetical protein IscW_ISCW019248 [Ixodes scapularis]
MDGDSPTAPSLGSDENSASPLSMQMSNSMIENGLDFEHGEGASAGIKATTDDAPQPLKRCCSPGDDRNPSPVVAKLARLDDPSACTSADIDDDFKNDLLEDDFGEADEGDGFTVGGDVCGPGDQGLPVLSFDILDEVGAGQGDEDDEDEDDANNGYGEGSESDISDDEIEAMLEAGLYTRKLDVDEDEDIAHEVKEKVILRVSSDKPAELAARVPAAKVESVKESQKERSLDFMAVREYCQGLFDFQTIQLKKFKNYGMGDTEIKQEMKNMKHQRNEFIMSVGKHSASVICRNKRDGKQRASQAILQEEEQRITKLQSKASANRPNLCILNKLKEEMAKLKERREAMKPIGKFIPQETEFPSTSASDLKVVEL